MRNDMRTLKFHNWKMRFSLRSACSVVRSFQSVYRETATSVERVGACSFRRLSLTVLHTLHQGQYAIINLFFFLVVFHRSALRMI